MPFDPVTGWLDFLQSGPGGSTSLQSLDYRWNKIGSLAQRHDANRSLTEAFFYDNLHRLDHSQLNGVQNLDLSYDALGNIKTKSDLGAGTWTYHAAKKHAVTSAGGVNYTYDANGTQITRAGQTVTWMSYNYPKRINLASGQYHEFSYDAGRSRWKQLYVNGGTTETTVYVADLLEKRTKGKVTEYRHIIQAGISRNGWPASPEYAAIYAPEQRLDYHGVSSARPSWQRGRDHQEHGRRRGPRELFGLRRAPQPEYLERCPGQRRAGGDCRGHAAWLHLADQPGGQSARAHERAGAGCEARALSAGRSVRAESAPDPELQPLRLRQQ